MSRRLIILACSLLVWSLSFAAQAESRRICVYDPVGKVGDYYAMLQDFALAAAGWGVDIELQAYTDEETAAKDYEAGVLATGVRLQRFNRFPTTLEAMGALPSYDLLEDMITSLATYEGAAKRLKSGDHETIGFIPIGAVWFFVRDRSVHTVPALAGIRIATMDYDSASPVMVDRVGAIRVPADLRSIGPKFNNGDVDAAYISAAGYQPFELWRGLDPDGGIVKLPLAQATLQLLVRSSSFPEGFGARSRTWFLEHFHEALDVVLRAEASIPESYWIVVPEQNLPAFDELFLGVRLKLRDEVGAYDPAMLSAMRKLRCSRDPARAECLEQKE